MATGSPSSAITAAGQRRSVTAAATWSASFLPRDGVILPPSKAPTAHQTTPPPIPDHRWRNGAPGPACRHRLPQQLELLIDDDLFDDRQNLGIAYRRGRIRQPSATLGGGKRVDRAGCGRQRAVLLEVGLLVARLRPTPDHATGALTSALSSVIPAVTSEIPKLMALSTPP